MSLGICNGRAKSSAEADLYCLGSCSLREACCLHSPPARRGRDASLHALRERGDALPDANAPRRQAGLGIGGVAAKPFAELGHQRGHQARARSAKRVPQGNSANVDDVGLDLQLLRTRSRLRGERLFEFRKIERRGADARARSMAAAALANTGLSFCNCSMVVSGWRCSSASTTSALPVFLSVPLVTTQISLARGIGNFRQTLRLVAGAAEGWWLQRAGGPVIGSLQITDMGDYVSRLGDCRQRPRTGWRFVSSCAVGAKVAGVATRGWGH